LVARICDLCAFSALDRLTSVGSEIYGQTVSRLMAAFRQGDKQAANELVEIFYPELRRLAHARMQREPTGHSWQPTLLVNEFYLELVKIKALPALEEGGGKEKAAFFALAAHVMKRLLIHHARPLRAKAVKVGVEDTPITLSVESVAELEVALARLGDIRPRLRDVVELKAFEGLSQEEIAERLGCSTATVTREWHFATVWLQEELKLA
jgi:RNA polymerase sigma factor (TIGR02999 family)